MESKAKVDALNIEEQIANAHIEVFGKSILLDVISILCYLLAIVLLLIGTYKLHRKTPSVYTLTMLVSVRLVLVFYVLMTFTGYVLLKQIGGMYIWHIYDFIEIALALSWLVAAFAFFKYSLNGIYKGTLDD